MRNTTTQARLREALALHGKTISIATAKLKGEILMNAGSKARIAILSSIGNNLVEQAQGAKNKLAKFDINLSATTRAALNKQLQALHAPSLGCPDKKSKKKKQCGCDDTMLNGLECLTPQQEISIGLGKTKEKSTYELITDMVVKKLETEKVLPWQKPWIGTDRKGKFRAKNFASKNTYSGVNAFILNYLFEYDINYYLTLKQIKKLKGKLVEGAERVPIVYYTAYYKNNETDKIISIENYRKLSEDQQNDYTFIQAIKHYWAYNAEFIEGIDWGVEAPEPLTPKEQIETAEAVFNSFKKGSKLIIHKKRRAFYNPNNDTVNMPPIEMFKKEQEYYSTLYHEYIHSTAHKTRLNRLIGDKFGGKNYALEELVAELGASFLCGEAGILYFTLNNSVSYLKGWKESLLAIVKKDSGFIFKAASEAQKAVEYLIQKEPTGNPRKYLNEKEEKPKLGDLEGVQSNYIIITPTKPSIDKKEALSVAYQQHQGKKVFNADKGIEITINRKGRDKTVSSANPSLKMIAIVDKLNHIIENGKFVSEHPPKANHIRKFQAVSLLEFYTKIKVEGSEKLEFVKLTILKTADNKFHYFVSERSAAQIVKSIKKQNEKLKPSSVKTSSTSHSVNDNTKKQNPSQKTKKPLGNTPQTKQLPTQIDNIFLRADQEPAKPAPESFVLKGEIGKLLQTIQPFKYAISLRGDRYSGKSTFTGQVMDAFADNGMDSGWASLEQGGIECKDTRKIRDEQIKKINWPRVAIAGELPNGIHTLKQMADNFDLVVVDSFQKLKVPNTELDSLRNEKQNTLWLVIFQENAEGGMRGGNSAEFDSNVILKVNKPTDDFKDNYVSVEKNRGNNIDFVYNIFEKKTYPKYEYLERIKAKLNPVKEEPQPTA